MRVVRAETIDQSNINTFRRIKTRRYLLFRNRNSFLSVQNVIFGYFIAVTCFRSSNKEGRLYTLN